MKTLRKRKVAKAYGYIYKLDFKLGKSKIYSLESKGCKYNNFVNNDYTNFETELANVIKWNVED